MSFILDALKKSENARQRQAGPALFEVKVAPPRRTLPMWAIVIGILLLINGVALSWILLRHRAAAPAAALARKTPPAAVRAMPAPRIDAAASSTPAAAPTTASAPVTTPASTPAPTRSATTRAAQATPTSQAVPQAAATPNPADLAPALQPPASGAQNAGGLPLYAQISAAPGSHLPRLHLDLHVYDQSPGKRFVMINMQKLRQGDSLPDGVSVVKIRPDGVVLSYQGRKFLLPR